MIEHYDTAHDEEPRDMLDEETRRRLADEVATTIRTQLEFHRPVRVEHEFNGFGKTMQRASSAVIMLLLTVVGVLLVSAWSMFKDSTDKREAFAREVAKEMQQAQIVRDSNQDDAIKNLNTTLVDLRGLIVKIETSLDARQQEAGENARRLDRLEDWIAGRLLGTEREADEVPRATRRPRP